MIREVEFLGDCCEIVSGATPDTNKKEFWDGEIFWVTPKDLSSLTSAYIQTTPRKITELGLKNCSAKILPVNSVLFSSRAPIGHVAINTVPMCTNQGFKSFVPDPKKVDSKYLYYWLKANVQIFENLGNGATFKEVSKTSVSKVQVPLPPLTEQKQIAEVLDKAASLREKRRLALQKLDTLLQSVFLEMFGDPVKNPKGWKKEKMGELMVIRRGGSPRPIDNFLGGEYNWIKIGDATKGNKIYLESSKEKITKEGLSKTVFLKAGSLIFANCGVSLGFARILKIDGCIHDGWLSFENIPENKLDKIFLLKALNSITNHFQTIAPSGTQPNLNTGIMKNFEMIVPPLELQKKFSVAVERIEYLRDAKMKSAEQTENLFQSLQQKAFKGELFNDEFPIEIPQEEKGWHQTSLF